MSRPAAEDGGLGAGRANNVLRHLYDLPTKEQEDVSAADHADARKRKSLETALGRAVAPRLPAGVSRDALRRRLDPARTVVLTCGNPSSMADIQRVADHLGMRFEKEDWKPAAHAEDAAS